MLDLGYEDRCFEIVPFRSTFHSKAGPVSKEDRIRTRRKVMDTALNMKLQINNASYLVQPGDRLCKSVEDEEHGGLTHGNTVAWVRLGGPDSNKPEFESLVDS